MRCTECHSSSAEWNKSQTSGHFQTQTDAAGHLERILPNRIINQSLSSFRKQRHRLALRQMADISNRTTNNVHGMAPPYLASYCTPVTSQTGRSNLRSVATGQLIVPRTRTAYGSRSFAIHGPVVRNSLPAELRSPDIYTCSENSWRLFCLTADSTFAEFSNLGYINVINNNNNNNNNAISYTVLHLTSRFLMRQ